MPFIRLSTDFTREAWVKQFAAELNIPVHAAVGHLVALFSAMLTECPEGFIADKPPFLVAEWAEWPGPARTFHDAFIGVIEPSGQIPDWDKISLPLRENKKAAERARKIRSTPGKNRELVFDRIFESAWGEYPKRAGGNSKTDAYAAWRAREEEGVQPLAMLEGVLRYKKYCDATGTTGTQFVKQAATFFGPGRHWENDYEPPKPQKPAPQSYSYEPLPPSPPKGGTGQFVTRAGLPEPVQVGRPGPLEITLDGD